MQKALLMMILGLTLSISTLAGIDAKLSFSTDDGKTWDTDFPLLKKAQEILVKVNWSIEENRDIKSNVLTTVLYCRERDFASANCGRQRWLAKNDPVWFQRLDKYWSSVKSPRSFIYRINLGTRKADVMGKKNKWVKGKGFVDGPLAACSAFTAGTYRFSIKLTYRIKKSNEAVNEVKEFDVTIEGPKQSSVSPKDSKKND